MNNDQLYRVSGALPNSDGGPSYMTFSYAPSRLVDCQRFVAVLKARRCESIQVRAYPTRELICSWSAACSAARSTGVSRPPRAASLPT